MTLDDIQFKDDYPMCMDISRPACDGCQISDCMHHVDYDIVADFREFKKVAFYHQTMYGDDPPDYALLEPGTEEHRKYWAEKESE